MQTPRTIFLQVILQLGGICGGLLHFYCGITAAVSWSFVNMFVVTTVGFCAGLLALFTEFVGAERHGYKLFAVLNQRHGIFHVSLISKKLHRVEKLCFTCELKAVFPAPLVILVVLLRKLIVFVQL